MGRIGENSMNRKPDKENHHSNRWPLNKKSIIIIALILIGGLFYLFYDDGSYYFRVEIDGVPVEGINSFADYSGGRLGVYTILSDYGKKGIIIFINASETGTYSLNPDPASAYGQGNYGQYHFGDEGNRTVFLSKGQYSGECKISKLDLNKKTVSGKFEFDAVESILTPSGYVQSSRIVHITNGRFDNVPIN